jgi:predicted  nucleic acid-binding Zn-ribbon protein
MHPELVKLLDLQAHDLELLDVDTRLLEVTSQVAALDEDLARAREGIATAERAVVAEKKRRDELETKIESHRQHQERRREKLEFMKTPKEVAALMAEIDLARSVLGNEENDWIRASDQLGSFEKRQGEAEEQVSAIEERQSAQRAALDAQRKALEEERETIKTRRDASAARVTKPVLQRYDKLRNSTSRRSVVVVALSGPACGACFTTVPLSRRTVIRTGAAIEGCESCGVILYFAE